MVVNELRALRIASPFEFDRATGGGCSVKHICDISLLMRYL
jgi:hypothetical protein